MIIQNAKLRGKEGLWNIVVKDGKFGLITQSLETTANEEVIDVGGSLVRHRSLNLTFTWTQH